MIQGMRMRRIGIGAALAAFCLLPQAGSGQTANGPAPLKLVLHAIKDGKLYWVEGDGGNSGIVIGDKGVVVIDAKTTAEGGAQLVSMIAGLTPKPITHVIETHSDTDHVGGIVSFPRDVKIIAHLYDKIEQQTLPLYAAAEVGGGKCLPAQDRLPGMLIDKPLTRITLDGVPFIFHYYGPAHTSGDLVVELPADRFVFTGDIITNNAVIHPEKMGTMAGWFKTANAILALKADGYLGGHASSTDTKETLRRNIADRQAVKDKVYGLMDQGKSWADIKAVFGKDAEWTVGCRGVPRPSEAEDEFIERSNAAQIIR